VPKERATKLYELYINFEKEHGSKDEVDEVIIGERRNIYKDELSKNSLNYDAWINLLTLE
jgi:crooked neck